MSNTSQDPEYVGATGHEKKFHQTHFPALKKKLKITKDNGYEWVRIAPGKFIRRKKDGKEKDSNKNN